MTMDYTEFYKTCYLRIHAFAQGRVSVGAAGDEVWERTDIPMGRAKLWVHMFMTVRNGCRLADACGSEHRAWRVCRPGLLDMEK